jgi:hypothetical protein
MSPSRLGSRVAVAILLALLALPMGAALAQQKSFVYDRIDVQVDVHADGRLDVAETMTLAYTGGPFSFVSRSIALQRLDDIRDIQLSEGGRAYTEAQGSQQPGSFKTERSADTLKVTWYYEPTSNAARTFTLRYHVLGAVRISAEADEVWWVAIFPERSVPVQHSQVALQLPTGAQLRAQDVTLPAASGSVAIEGNTVRVVRDEPLPAGQSLDLRVDFAPSLVSASPPAWQSAPAAQPVPDAPSAPAPDVAASGLGSFGSPFCWAIFFILGILLLRFFKGVSSGSGSSTNSYRRSRSRSWSSSDSGSSWSDSGSSWSDSGSSSSGSSWSDSGSSSSDSGGSGGGGGDAG